MKVKVERITSAINKIADYTSGDKQIPGVLFNISKENSTLEVCYTDGHKALIDTIDEVEMDETDHEGGAVVSFEKISRAIANCQPSGSIKVQEVGFKFKEGNIIEISADQYIEIKDSEGNIEGQRQLATKRMDVNWSETNADRKVAVLTKMDYNSIFNTDDGVIPDEYNRVELIDILNRTSTEKGKQIYISHKSQTAFVVNQGHATSMPISHYEVSEQRKNEIKSALMNEKGAEYTDQMFIEACEKESNRIHGALTLGQSMAKSLVSILGRAKSENVYMYRKDIYCNAYIDSEDERIGIWFEMPKASNTHTSVLDRYQLLKYDSYQLLFLREFLDNNIRSALATTKNAKVELRFEATQIEEATTEIDLVIPSNNSMASVSDNYRVNMDDYMDNIGDIMTKKLNVSLQVLADMLSQLKTTLVAFDIQVGENGSMYIRLAEVDTGKMTEEHTRAVELYKAQCVSQGIEYNPNAPLPSEIKKEFRERTLICRQYATLI